MKFIVALITFTIMNISCAQINISDDGLHFGAGIVISGVTYSLVYSKTQNKKKAFWFSFGLSTLAGLSKEIYDGYIIDGKFDNSELIFTTLGGLSASYSFNIFTGKKKKEAKEKFKTVKTFSLTN